jgi:tripartite-type tricarboxylate transporter receptor subunit TctC
MLMMRMARRQFLHLAAGAVGLPTVSRVAWAQAYPSRPVRLIVGFAAGGAPDIIARLVGQSLSERLGQQFVIENRTGAGGNIAMEAVVNAPADGYTLLLVPTAAAINAALYPKLNYDFIRDVAPVAGIVRVPNVMMVNASVPARTIPEFIAHARANPGKISMASAGTGSGPHLGGELFKMMAGIDMVHVPYRGSAPALTDLIGGRVQVLFSNTPAEEHFRSGKLRALAVTTTTRSQALPDVPAVTEFLPGYEASAWFGIGAPRNTPTAIVETLNTAIRAGLANPKIKARLSDLGGMVLAGSPTDFGTLVADETEKWGKVIRFAGIKLD